MMNRTKLLRGGRVAAIGMVLALSILVVMASLSGCRRPVVVNFPDPRLEAAIRDSIGKPTGEILDTDLMKLVVLDVGNYQNVMNLEGIQYCTSLTKLSLLNNQIVDISPLSGLANLEWLSLSGNPIIDISPLSGLTNLAWLNLSYNQGVNITPLSGLTNLTELHLHHSQIVDITPLSSLTNLERLDLSYNEIVNISPLSRLTNLGWLYLRDNQIVDVSSLSSLTNLEWISLQDNQIVDIQPLVDNPGLGISSTGGAVVIVSHNNLNLTPRSHAMLDIEALQDRSISLIYEPQN